MQINHQKGGVFGCRPERNDIVTPLNLSDPQEVEDFLSDAITDSMDMDWNGQCGAMSIMAAMEKDGICFAREETKS